MLSLPLPWPQDAVSAMAHSHLHVMGYGITGGFGREEQQKSGPYPGSASRFLQRFLTGARVNGLREGTLKQVSTFYWMMAMALSSGIAADVRASPEFQALVKRVGTSLPDIARLRSELASIRAHEVQRLAAEVPPFALALAEVLTVIGSTSPETTLREAFADAVDRMPDPERAREVLSAWEQEARERMQGPEGLAGIVDVVDKASCEVELAAVLNLFDLFGMVADAVASSGETAGNEGLRRMRALSQTVRDRIKGRVFSRPARDWAAWRTGRVATVVPTSPTPAASAAGGRPAWLWPVVGVAALGAVAVLLLRRRRSA